MTYAKLKNGAIEFAPTVVKLEFEGGYNTRPITQEEIIEQGYKPFIKATAPTTDVYHYAQLSYEETADSINEVYTKLKKSEEEIIELNKAFWNAYTIKVDTPLTKALNIYIVRQTKDEDGTIFDTLKDDAGNTFMGNLVGSVPVIGVLPEPDYTQPLFDTDVKSLEITMTEPNVVKEIVKFQYELAYGKRLYLGINEFKGLGE